MKTNMTVENLLQLQAFLHESGLLKRLKPRRARAVCEDLFGLVGCIAAEAVKRAKEDLVLGAIVVCEDALDSQQERLFENWVRQMGWPQ